MSAGIDLSDDVRYRLVVHAQHEGQVGPDAPPWEDGQPMYYCGIIVEHRTSDPDYDGRPGHVSHNEAGWCPGHVEWCGLGQKWTLVSFDPLSLTPSVQCTRHPDEFHIYVTNGAVA